MPPATQNLRASGGGRESVARAGVWVWGVTLARFLLLGGGMERILVGLDGSARSPHVLRAAVELARRTGSKLFLYRAAPELRGDLRVSMAVSWQGVCEAAHATRADLIVIGSHGYGGLDRVLGTTAAKVVNHAEGSVLVVKAERSAP